MKEKIKMRDGQYLSRLPLIPVGFTLIEENITRQTVNGEDGFLVIPNECPLIESIRDNETLIGFLGDDLEWQLYVNGDRLVPYGGRQ
jgi:hypothetical protein